MSELPSSEYTGTFFELLEKAGKSLVISTYQARKLVILRALGTKVNTHFVNLQKPMGMAFHKKRLSVGSGNSVIDYFNSNNAAAKIVPENTHDAAFLPRRVHITGDIDIHEMAFDGKDTLWIVNTRMSCLCTLDTDHSFVPQWRPPFISAYDSTDRCHLNGLAMRDGRPKYVTALGKSDDAAGWRDEKAFGGVLMDIEANTVIAAGLSMPHSPRWYKNKIWVLESGAGQLITIDEDTGAKTVIAQVPGFCRGLDFVERYAIIGLSEVRETAIFAGLPLTAREQHRKCGVWIVDIETGQIAGYFAFTSGVQEIFSVQSLPMRFPTLLDFDHKLLNTSFSVPNNVVKEFVGPDPRQVALEQAAERFQHKQFKEAIALYQIVLKEDTNDTHVLYCLAEALTQDGQWDAAIVYIDKVISIQNDHAQAHHLRGRYFARENTLDTAIDCYQKAIAIDQQFAAAHYNRGCAELLQGHFEKGWQDFEWRKKIPGYKNVSLPHPEWRGDEISDKTLLVVTNEKVEDAILFARFLPLVKRRCSKLILVCDESLQLIFRDIDAVDEVRGHGTLPRDLFDVYVPLTSLGAVLKINEESLHTEYPYLSINKRIPAPVIGRGSNRVQQTLRIGLVWSGSPEQVACSLEQFITLSDNPNVDAYSFQMPVFAEDRLMLAKHNVTNLEPELNSFAAIGALAQQMDLMVCVPSAAAHLSGALGVPTIVLLSDYTDWRWSSNRQNSIWYPSVQTIQSQKTGNWRSAIELCESHINAKINGRY